MNNSMERKQRFLNQAFITTFEGDEPLKDTPKDTPKVDTFTQEQVNTMVSEAKRKAQTDTQSALDELQALKAKADLSAEERTDLEGRIETLTNTLLTKDELAKKEQERLVNVEKAEKDTAVKKAQEWESRYTESTIIRTITDAAVTNEALVPEQLVAILKPDTFLAKQLDAEGKETGELVAKIKRVVADSAGKEQTLELTIPEAIKNMREIDKYQNLFKSEGTSGIFSNNNAGGNRNKDISKLAQDPVAYREARKAGKV